MKYWQDFSGKGRCWGLRKDIHKDLKCIFFYADDFIYYIVEVLARLFWEEVGGGSDTSFTEKPLPPIEESSKASRSSVGNKRARRVSKHQENSKRY